VEGAPASGATPQQIKCECRAQALGRIAEGDHDTAAADRNDVWEEDVMAVVQKRIRHCADTPVTVARQAVQLVTQGDGARACGCEIGARSDVVQALATAASIGDRAE